MCMFVGGLNDPTANKTVLVGFKQLLIFKYEGGKMNAKCLLTNSFGNEK